MPPRTRARGPPEGGFTHLSAQSRETNPISSPQIKLPRQQKKTQPRTKTKKMVIPPIAVPALTEQKEVQTPRKRPLEGNDDDEPQRALKRPNTEPRPQRPLPRSTPLFGDRNRSALTPGRFNRTRQYTPRKRLPLTNPVEAEAQQVSESLPKIASVEPEGPITQTETQTPTPKKQWLVGRVFGSIRKVVFGAGQEESPAPEAPASPTPILPAPVQQFQENPFEAAPINPRRTAQASRLAKVTTQRQEVQFARKNSKQATVEDAMDSPDQPEHDLQTTEIPGSRKRKLDTATEDRQPKKLMLNADENGKPTGSYGITEEDLELSDDEGDLTLQLEEAKSKSQDTTKENEVPEPSEMEQPEILKTPGTLGLDNFEPSFSVRGKALRSAMKAKPNTTTKKVGFSAQLEHHRVYGDLGPAGEYKGTLFRYPQTPDDHDFSNTSPMSLDTPSTTTPGHIDKERTFNNTNMNVRKNRIDAANNATEGWVKTQETTPVITNKSGHFEVPFVDDESLQQDSPATEVPEEPTPVPSAPKIPHASLPDPDERLNKARQEAQQYKPKQSSRLSNVEPAARSRSTSPAPVTAPTTNLHGAEEMPKVDERTTGFDWPEPLAYEDADEETKAKMRAYDAEAAAIQWPEPMTYVEAGLVSPFIDQLLRERWNKEDDRLTHEFWSKEFNDVDKMMRAARADGKTLELVYEED